LKDDLVLKIIVPSILLFVAILSPYLIGLRSIENVMPFTMLIYSDNNTTLKFTIKGSLIVNNSYFIIVEKTTAKEKITYYVDYKTRKIFYLTKFNNEEYLGFSGIYTVLWFYGKPKLNSAVPLLDHYGVIVFSNETSFKIIDYYNVSLEYNKVGDNIYVLSSYGGLKLRKLILKTKSASIQNVEYLAIILTTTLAIIITSAALIYKILKHIY